MRACSQAPFPPAAQLPPYSGGEPSDRARLIHSVVDLALREPFEELSAPHIANEADLSIDTFLDLFESPQECFMAALDMLGAELLEVVADPALITPQWPQAVCEAIDRLSAHIAGNPAATTMLACKTFAAGLPVIEDMVSLTDEVATLLTEGAPRRARGTLAVEGVSGAFAHTLYTEAAAGRAHLLPSQVEYLSYIVLAPYMGAENAVQTIVASRPQPPPRPPSPALTQDAPTASTTTSAPAPRLALASLAQAALGKVREHDADKQRNHDHDDQWSLA
jgi:AcrR family transcriptional regulator